MTFECFTLFKRKKNIQIKCAKGEKTNENLIFSNKNNKLHSSGGLTRQLGVGQGNITSWPTHQFPWHDHNASEDTQVSVNFSTEEI